MAKMSRTQLKGIVKECLMEILLEGLDSKSDIGQLTESKISRTRKKRVQKTPRRPALDSIQVNSNIQERVSSLTSDPIMGEIFKDTAQSGLVESIQSTNAVRHEDQISRSGDQAAKMAASADPVDLFGDASNNWADLAFSSK